MVLPLGNTWTIEATHEYREMLNRLRADECDDHPVHGRRIAQAGFARYPSAGHPRGPSWSRLGSCISTSRSDAGRPSSGRRDFPEV